MAINTIPAGADFTYVNGQSDLRRVSRRIDTIGAFVRNTAACSFVSDIITIPVAASNNDVEVIDSRNTKFIPANSLVTSIGIFFPELFDVGASGVLKVGFGPTTGDESIVGQTTLNGAGNDVTINSFISTSNGAVAAASGAALVIKSGAATYFANASSLFLRTNVSGNVLAATCQIKVVAEFIPYVTNS